MANSASQLRFRPAHHGDIPSLCNLLEALFTLESDFQPDRAKQERALQLLIDKAAANPEHPGAIVWLAEHDAQVIGMCSVQILISTAEGGEVGLVEDVIIDAGYRGQGVGSEMLRSLEVWVRERGLTRLQLLADIHNTRALDFYAKRGWERMQMRVLRHPLN